jgi:Amt family ammonium transporter
LVAITPCCAFVANWASVLIGLIAGLVSIGTDRLLPTTIDDPIGCVSSHGAAAIWGLIATALFVNVRVNGNDLGLFYSGDFHLLGIQCIEIVSISAWAAVTSFLSFKLIDRLVGLRLTEEEETIGSDYLEHLSHGGQVSPRVLRSPARNVGDIDIDAVVIRI